MMRRSSKSFQRSKQANGEDAHVRSKQIMAGSLWLEHYQPALNKVQLHVAHYLALSRGAQGRSCEEGEEYPDSLWRSWLQFLS
jgi:hypothetical protein